MPRDATAATAASKKAAAAAPAAAPGAATKRPSKPRPKKSAAAAAATAAAATPVVAPAPETPPAPSAPESDDNDEENQDPDEDGSRKHKLDGLNYKTIPYAQIQQAVDVILETQQQVGKVSFAQMERDAKQRIIYDTKVVGHYYKAIDKKDKRQYPRHIPDKTLPEKLDKKVKVKRIAKEGKTIVHEQKTIIDFQIAVEQLINMMPQYLIDIENKRMRPGAATELLNMVFFNQDVRKKLPSEVLAEAMQKMKIKV